MRSSRPHHPGTRTFADAQVAVIVTLVAGLGHSPRLFGRRSCGNLRRGRAIRLRLGRLAVPVAACAHGGCFGYLCLGRLRFKIPGRPRQPVAEQRRAEAEEKTDRIEHHHDHVRNALKKFQKQCSQEQVEQEALSQQAGVALGAQVATATNLLNLFLPEIQDQNLYQQVVQLRILAERGVITVIAKRLQRMQKEMQRGKLKRDEALSQIIEMAKKYNAYYLSAEEMKHETETEAQIILSESFK